MAFDSQVYYLNWDYFKYKMSRINESFSQAFKRQGCTNVQYSKFVVLNVVDLI